MSVRKIIGLGEALFDVFPDETRLGGAPLNFAVHAHQLGNEGIVVSRVGQDELGRQLYDELRSREMSLDHVQTDPDKPTGTVNVSFGGQGRPSYDIVEDVAWDWLQYDPGLEWLAGHCDAVCFGSLAQRQAQARNTIYRFLKAARSAVRLFDVNLRQDYYSRRALSESCEFATAVKLNTEELDVLADMFELGGRADDAVAKMREQFQLDWVAVTGGEAGTVVYTADGKHEAAPVRANTSEGDAVGAGDATAAALVHGLLKRWDWPRTLKLANELGAYVASKPGACPPLYERIKALASGKEPA